MINENKKIFNKLVDTNNQLNLLNYIYASLSYSYDEMMEKLEINGDIAKLVPATQAFGDGLKLSEKDFQKLYEYINNYSGNINIYLSNKTFNEIENQIKLLKEEKLKLEKQMEKILNKDTID